MNVVNKRYEVCELCVNSVIDINGVNNLIRICLKV